MLTNDELHEKFKCGKQGGMRRSTATNSLVLVYDHTKELYNDIWEGSILHYTGMGQQGNQSLDFHQNRTLAGSDISGIDLFLFEVFEEGKYTYQGRVKLAGKPYLGKQPDVNRNLRDVWIFPIKLAEKESPAPATEEALNRARLTIEKQTSRWSTEELKRVAEAAPRRGGSRDVLSKQYERNPYVTEYVKRKADGMCQLRDSPAPFGYKNGEPYLEVHHIDWLSKGGEDTIEDTVALCPNCHRRMHVLDLQSDRDKLMNKH